MKKALLSLTTVCIVLFFSCKKEDNNSTPKPTISSDDPVALSKSIKIWHATRSTGTVPLPTGGAAAPVVTAPPDNVQALAGGFAVIQPSVISGSIAGYYVGIEGAGEYFKLDYSRPRNAERPFIKKPKGFLQRPMEDNDSSIVVVLPSNLQVPDTFCITYLPYDPNGNIGDPVTTCIIVNRLGGDASSSWINGSWRYMGHSDTTTNAFNTVLYNTWDKQEDAATYYCTTDITGNPFIASYCGSSTCSELDVTDSVLRFADDISLGTNGGMQYLDSSVTKMFNPAGSNCGNFNFLFNPVTPDVNHVHGGWSLTGNILTLVYQFDEFEQSDYRANEYIVTRPDNNTMILDYKDGSTEKFLLKRL